jgi:competence protein ComEA
VESVSEPPNVSNETKLVSSTKAPAPKPGFLVKAVALLGVIAITVIITLWVSRDSEQSGVEIVIPSPAPTTFQVSGEVVKPGVYSLDGEPRVNDAIDAAGGFTVDANSEVLNLALPVREGAKVVVPSLDESANDTTQLQSALPNSNNDQQASSDSTDVPAITGGLIDLNTATKEQLIALPGIGEVRADSIIEWRANNLINSVSDLLAISGIGPSTVDSIRDYVVQP